jgi:hypothetical protein
MNINLLHLPIAFIMAIGKAGYQVQVSRHQFKNLVMVVHPGIAALDIVHPGKGTYDIVIIPAVIQLNMRNVQ